MNCKQCGAPNEEGTHFCVNCGAPLSAPQGHYTRADSGSGRSGSTARPYSSAPPYRAELTQEQLPEKFRPLSPWAYFGYGILFSIPLVGFICLIVFSFNNDNINRRNYARSYFIVLILALILVIVLSLLGILGGLWVRYR